MDCTILYTVASELNPQKLTESINITAEQVDNTVVQNIGIMFLSRKQANWNLHPDTDQNLCDPSGAL